MIHSPCGVSPRMNVRCSCPSTFISRSRCAASRAGPPAAAPVPSSGYASRCKRSRAAPPDDPRHVPRFPRAPRGVNGLFRMVPRGPPRLAGGGPRRRLRPLKTRIEARLSPPRVAGAGAAAALHGPPQRHRAHQAGAQKPVPHGSQHGAKHRPLVFEAHFGLGRVHVDVHRGRIHRQMKHGQRIPPGRQQRLVPLLDGPQQRGAVDPAPVEKHRHAVPVAVGGVGPPDEARAPAARPARSRRAPAPGRRGLAVHGQRRRRPSRRRRAWRTACRPSARSRNATSGRARAMRAATFGHPPPLGRFGAQELVAGRRVEKQPPHDDGGARRACRRAPRARPAVQV